MKTHYFFINDKGQILWIQNMPRRPFVLNPMIQDVALEQQYKNEWLIYNEAVELAKVNALIVDNPDLLKNWISNDIGKEPFQYVEMKLNQVYSFECEVEVKQNKLFVILPKKEVDRTSFEEQDAIKYCQFLKETYGEDSVRVEEQKPNFSKITTDHFERVGKRDDKREHDIEWLAYKKGYIDGYYSKPPVEEQQEEWIRVEDQLPKSEGRYLTYRANGIVIVEHWFKNDSKFLWGKCYGVTHWQPLPKPPVKNQS